MRLDHNTPEAVGVTLSRRNLRVLLSKLDRPDSARTIFIKSGDTYLVVAAENDDVHYRDHAPGRMHPDDERGL